MYETKKQILNVAIKRLAMIDKKNKMMTREKRLANWEKLFIRLSEAKGHGKRWKFRMDAFKQKASEGYDELVHWALSEPAKHDDTLLESSRGRKAAKERVKNEGDFGLENLRTPSIDEKKSTDVS